MKPLKRVVRAAGLGVWDFVVGDTPEFVATVAVAVGLALAVHTVRLAVVVGLPAVVILSLAVSVRRTAGRLRTRPPRRHSP